jgi:hypothetical protein
MLGSPYEITRSDMGNPKGITLLDLSNGEETYFPNEFSPKFKKLYFDEILDMNSLEVEELFRNNFVDIMIDPRMALKAPLNIITDTIQSQRKLSFHPYDPEQANRLSVQIMETDGKQFNVLDFIGEYVRTIETDEDTKDKIKRSLGKLYQTVVEKDQENREL